jgi:hypothetical protein
MGPDPSFPSVKHDDQVDALGLIGQLLDRVLLFRVAPTWNEAFGRHKRWKRRHRELYFDDLVG